MRLTVMTMAASETEEFVCRSPDKGRIAAAQRTSKPPLRACVSFLIRLDIAPSKDYRDRLRDW